MNEQKPLLIAIIAVLLLAGFGYFIATGRPTATDPGMEILPTATSTPSTVTSTNPTPTPTPNSTSTQATSTAEQPTTGADTYDMAQVQAHNTEASCWTTINNQVYNLTSWISRHPGGPQRIINLCGKDGTEAFTRKHGSSERANMMLTMLKIGTLAK